MMVKIISMCLIRTSILNCVLLWRFYQHVKMRYLSVHGNVAVGLLAACMSFSQRSQMFTVQHCLVCESICTGNDYDWIRACNSNVAECTLPGDRNTTIVLPLQSQFQEIGHFCWRCFCSVQMTVKTLTTGSISIMSIE